MLDKLLIFMVIVGLLIATGLITFNVEEVDDGKASLRFSCALSSSVESKPSDTDDSEK